MILFKVVICKNIIDKILNGVLRWLKNEKAEA